MKKSFSLVIWPVLILLVACQSATPTLPASETPPATATAAPTLQPSETPIPTAIKPVYVTAFCTSIGKDPETVVSRGTPIIIIWGWSAKTEAQINDFLQNNLTTITLDGKAIEGVMSDGIKKNETSGQPEVVWYSEVGVLDPGQHTVTYDVSWKKMIDDGTTTYGPGSPHETEHDECQIIVQ
jgi:hypothetical protein